MSKTVDETHRIAGIILEHLFVKPLRWSDLEKLTTRSSPTYSKFQTVLSWLASNGFIKKGLQHRDPYVITNRGKAFLEVLKQK